MIVQVLVGVISLSALCGAAFGPMETADIQLTASDADTGNWTANMGEMEVNIEHEHNSGKISNGTWTLSMARIFYDKDEEEDSKEEHTSEEKTNEISESIINTERYVPPVEAYYPPTEVYGSGEDGISLTDKINSIPVDETPSKDSLTPDSYSPVDLIIPQQVGPPPEIYRMLPPPLPPQRMGIAFPQPPQPMGFIPPYRRYAPFAARFKQQTDNSFDSDEIVTDPDNYEYFKGIGWFKLDDREMSWEEARDACSTVGAHLAVPDTQDRVSVFLKLFQRHPEIPRTAILREQVYVGVSDPLKTREFTTVQGNLFNPDFPIWFTSEPDNAPPGEDCVTFHIEGRTRDVPCFYSLPFICEKDLPVVI